MGSSANNTQQIIDLVTALSPIALELLKALEPAAVQLGQVFAGHINDLVAHAKGQLTAAS